MTLMLLIALLIPMAACVSRRGGNDGSLLEQPEADIYASAPRSGHPTREVPSVTQALAVRNIRLEAASPIDSRPSVNLKFDLANEGSDGLTGIVLEVAVAESTVAAPGTRMLAGPFLIHSKVTLAPGHVITYEIRLRDLAPDCTCRARIGVLSASVPNAPAIQ